MDQGPDKPTEDSPPSDWGQRRQGNSPPPRAGWARPDEPPPPDESQAHEDFHRASQAWERQAGGASPDLSAVFVLLDTLRQAAPAELQERTTALIRELLLTLRSLIDWYLERLDRPAEKPKVEDIPIE